MPFAWKRHSVFLASGAALALLLSGAALYARFTPPRLEPMVTQTGRALGGFCAAAAQALCKKRLECRQLGAQQAGACLDQAGAECERTLGWKLSSGVLAVDAEAQGECLEAVGEAGCNALQAMLGDDEPDLFEITNRCEMGEMLKPRSGLGGACAETSDCTSGFCPGLAPQCHRCTPYVQTGQPCLAGERECDPSSSFCAAGEASGSPEAVCHKLGEDSAPCAAASQCRSRACNLGVCGGAALGAPCSSAAGCAGDRFCKVIGSQGSCQDRVKTGEACVEQPAACAEQEARCVAGKCQVRPFVLGAGSVCRDFTDCKDGLYCRGSQSGNAEGRCAAQGRSGEGCDRTDYGACGADSACLDSKCRQLRKSGEKCSGPYQCKAFLSCLPSSAAGGFKGGASCMPSPQLGQACNPNLACVASFCDAASGHCIALAEGGARCASSEECASGWCKGPLGQATCYAPCAPAKATN